MSTRTWYPRTMSVGIPGRGTWTEGITMLTAELAAVPVEGALNRRATSHGWSFDRLPDWAMQQIQDPGLSFTYRLPAGVRIVFCTDADALELDVMLTLLQLPGRTPMPAAFDLVVGGELVESVSTTQGTVIVTDHNGGVDIVDKGQTTVRFDQLPVAEGAEVEIWLPHTAGVELRALRIFGGTGIWPVRSTRTRWAHYGSSISHCMEAPTPTGTWPALVARRLGLDLVNLAAAGQCQLDQCVARAIRDIDVDLISIKAGVNVLSTLRERTFVPALHGFLDTVRDGHPTTPVVVATPIIFPEAEDQAGTAVAGEDGRYRVVPMPPLHAEGALTLRRIRELIDSVVATRQEAGDSNLHLIDGLDLFGPPDVEELPDGLHPSPAGYRTIAERFAPRLAAIAVPPSPS